MKDLQSPGGVSNLLKHDISSFFGRVIVTFGSGSTKTPFNISCTSVSNEDRWCG
jgi:hypothetical protein